MPVTNPQSIRVENFRKQQSLWRGRVRWKNLVKEHAHVLGAYCVHCLRKHGDPIIDRKGNRVYDRKGNQRFVYLTINHKSRAKYWSEDLYCTWDGTDMEICCNDCNRNIEKGLKRCPICHEVYIGWQDYCCQKCWDSTHPVEYQKRIAENERRKQELKDLKKRIKADQKAKNERYKIDHQK